MTATPAADFARLVDADIPPLAEAHTFGGSYQVHMAAAGSSFLLAQVPGPAAVPVTFTTHPTYAAAVRAMADRLEADEATEIG